jgi:molybdopterin converting factor small subunit
MAGFSLKRKDDTDASEYRTYLKSAAWRRRRKRWFVEAHARGEEVTCLVCHTGTLKSLDLHHVEYPATLRNAAGQFESTEEHDWLIPLTRECHDALHQRLDEQAQDYYGVSRRQATIMIVATLRRKKIK